MYFSTKYLCPYPQNPILGDLSMQNLLNREFSVSRTLMQLRLRERERERERERNLLTTYRDFTAI